MISFDSDAMARNIKVERVKRGWSQEDLAKASGVGLNSIARYETGNVVPGLDNALKLAKALGCSIDDIAGLTPSQHSA